MPHTHPSASHHPAHEHQHEPDHKQAHPHHSIDNGRSFLIAIVLNIVFVMTEFAYGLMANSTALMADAGHNLSDVLGLMLAWGATLLARQVPNEHFTYGLRSSSILAALANAVLLLVACGGIAWEAMSRLTDPPTVVGSTVMWVAALGIAVNGVSAWLFMHGSKHDLNIRGAYLHMLADAAVSFGVVLAGLAILVTGWDWLDPLISLLIVAVIVVGTWNLLREATQLALLAVPKGIDLLKVAQFLEQQPGITAVHDLHIWAMSTTESALTVHLVMPEGYPGDAFMDALTQALQAQFSIAHSTLQIEQGTTQHHCSLNEPIKFAPLHSH